MVFGVLQQVLILLVVENLRKLRIVLHNILYEQAFAQWEHIFDMLLQRNVEAAAAFAHHQQPFWFDLHVAVWTTLSQQVNWFRDRFVSCRLGIVHLLGKVVDFGKVALDLNYIEDYPTAISRVVVSW